ncbi:MAG TPA: aminotransferase class IV [Verrucomicrobiae bacterium]|jgi:branched-chain amino acid aminotransferase|nr:aminotransferase class IV [Verrucomicrobiae bacterium]
MIAFLNGDFIPEEQAKVSILDRGFLYGDGLFEVMSVFRGRPFRWNDHMSRLQQGAAFLKIRIPFAADELREHALQLIERNGLTEGLLRLTLSRGVGVRGYSPAGAEHPTLTMTVHPASETKGEPPVWRVVTASFRLPAGEALAQFKTCNKLSQVLARAEADARGADEALLLNTEGKVVEGSSSNLFWITKETVNTPPLAAGILAGVTRVVVLEICGKIGVPIRETGIIPAELRRADGVFLSLSSRGVVEAGWLDDERLGRSSFTQRLREAYVEMTRNCPI